MKVLLDTHAFLWWITDDPQLSPKARKVISDGHNTLYWSAASSWEISIKYALGRLPLPETPEEFLPVELGKNRIESLSVIDAHAFLAGRLPRHHSDPFDRMLVAQAQIESLVIISNDRKLIHYDIDIHW
jgi:PIN domain nuclease of toxin-antitoxin system